MLSLLRPLLCLVLVSPLSALAEAPVDLKGPLPIDGSVQYRALANGMRYWVRPDTRPEGKISLWLRIGSGSINEEERERGLAHFLEHLAFNGSDNFPAGTLIKRFEAAGLTFGAHQNATTGFIDTIYKLTIPNDPALLDLSLLYFADVSHRLTIDPREVARERTVVQAERRARDNAASRAFRRHLTAIAPNSRFAARMPIGDPEVIHNATAEQLRAYYRKWYRPDNTTLLVAGDVDPAALETLVRKHFGDWAPAAEPAPNHAAGIKPYRRDRAEIVSEYGLVSADFTIAYMEPPRDFTNIDGYRAWLVHGIGKHLINGRLRDRVLEGDVPFVSASTAGDTAFGKTLVETRAKGAPRQWEAVTRSILTEIKLARERGFSDAEFRHAKQVMLAAFERDALNRPDARAEQWLKFMDAALDEDRAPMSGEQAYQLFQRLLPTISRAEVEAAVRARYAPARRTFTLALPRRADLPVPTPEQLLAVVRAAEAETVAERAERTWPRQLLLEDPQPGRTVGHTLNGELNVLSASLANGVRLHIRPMAYKKNQVSVRVTLAGGRINETPLNLGITEVAALPLKTPATEQLSSIDIRRIMQTKQVSVSGRETAGALELNIEGQQSDLEDGFRLAHLLLTRARIEPAMFERWRREAAVREANLEGSVSAQLYDRVDALLTNNDPRFRGLSPKEVRRLTLEESQAWLDDMLATAPIEVAIVGDITHDEALVLAAKYIGSLPKRPAVAGAYDEARAVRAAPGPYEEKVLVDTATPKAMVYLGWRGPDWQDVHDRQVMELAGRILTSRLLSEVRERRGLAYSIRAHAFSNSLYRGNGRFRVSFVVDPLRAEEAADVAERVVEQFLQSGPTAEEIATAREQAAVGFRSGSHSPAFWLDILSDLDYMGGNLWWVNNYLETVQQYTREDMLEVLSKYLRSERFVRVIGVPSETAPAQEQAPRQAAATID